MNIRNYRNLFRYEMYTDPKSGKERRRTVYVGPYYTLGLDERGRKKLALVMAGLWAPALAAFLIGGFMNTPSGQCNYVAPFYMLQLIPLVYWLVGWISCLKLPEKMTELQKRENFLSVRHAALGQAVFAGATAVADGIFGITGGWAANITAEVIFMGLTLLGGLCGLVLYRVLKRLTLTEVK